MSDKTTISLDTVEQKVSYGFGLQFGQQLINNNFDGLDINAVFTAMHHMINGGGSSLSEAELNTAYETVQEKMKAKVKADSEKALADGQAFLERFAQQTDTQKTDSGICYQVLNAGSGPSPNLKTLIKTHYHGCFIDGRVFDSSVDRGEPAEFAVNEVIPGWTEILQLMPLGAKWKVVIPQHLAYGPKGAPPAIPPCSTLQFEIELLDIIEE